MAGGEFSLQTTAVREFVDITGLVQEAVKAAGGVEEGVLVLHNPHTTAALTINEGADPDVARDLLAILGQIVPERFPYRHREGNSPAHLMTLLTGSSVQVLISGGNLRLGTWQRIFFCEYDGPRQRKVWWQLIPA